ncbi:hypothetical protein GLV94_05220 [Virgibacillus halodenitrificans]|uniref:hypothetical protein n=1 Tax=Virgibacillus halodenitrificans TaxID=1482 RepID=UPI00136FAA2E|nr:hypothetical protein [Virgibacillus halodenitrificans]MYL45035.1 hypothetical protein [Virgibacillus halodenitrificans]
MSDRERLEEIKERWYSSHFVNNDDIDYLIQQAERVQEVENAALFTHNMQADRIKELEKEQLSTSKLNLLNRIDNLKNKVSSLEEGNKRHKRALKFYADEDNHIKDEWKPLNPKAKTMKMSQVDLDNGELARQALKGESE